MVEPEAKQEEPTPEQAERFEQLIGVLGELGEELAGVREALEENTKKLTEVAKKVDGALDIFDDLGDVSANGVLPAVADLVKTLDLTRTAIMKATDARNPLNLFKQLGGGGT